MTSPHFAEIRDRALAMLRSEAGFNGHPRDELWSRKCNRWIRDNAIGVALCTARDAVERRECAPGRAGRLTKGEFERAKAEIRRLIRSDQP